MSPTPALMVERERSLARDDFQAVEVIEHRLDPLRQPALIGNVPWRERPVRLRKNMHLGAEPYRPFIQVLLVAELSVLFACIAPFHAALLPPSQHARRRGAVGEGGELNAEPARSEE